MTRAQGALKRALARLPEDVAPLPRQRARALVILSWILIPAGFVFGALYHLILGTHAVGLAGDFLTISFIVAFIVLTRFGRIRAAAHVVALGTWIALVWGMALSGGFSSPYTAFSVLMMVWIGVLHTGRDTLLWGVGTALTMLVFIGLDQAGIALPDVLGGVGAHAFTVVAIPVGIAVVLGLNGLSRDMGRRAREHTDRLNQELQQALELAAQAAEVKQLFLTTMSHELRTPLSALIGSLGLLELQGDLSDKSRGYVRRMDEASETLLTVINDTIDWTHLETGGLSIRLATFDPKALCESVVDVVRDQATLREIELVLEVDASTPSVAHTDPHRVRQILLNLLNNALAYTDVGTVTVGLRGDAGNLILTVADTGSGIGDTELHALFAPFERLDRGWARAGGSGLGLAICKRFAEALGGEISVVSAIGEGSTFTVRLPVETPASFAPTP